MDTVRLILQNDEIYSAYHLSPFVIAVMHHRKPYETKLPKYSAFFKKVRRVVLNLFFWGCAICTLGSLAMIFYSAHFIVRHSFQYYQYVKVKCQRPWHLLKVNFYLKMRQAEAK